MAGSCIEANVAQSATTMTTDGVSNNNINTSMVELIRIQYATLLAPLIQKTGKFQAGR